MDITVITELRIAADDVNVLIFLREFVLWILFVSILSVIEFCNLVVYMYIRYVKKIWWLLVVVFIVRSESKRLPKLMVIIMRFIFLCASVACQSRV